MPVFVPGKAGILPLPEAFKPIPVLVFVQENDVAFGLLKSIALVLLPLQTVWLLIVFAVATGFTVTKKSV